MPRSGWPEAGAETRGAANLRSCRSFGKESQSKFQVRPFDVILNISFYVEARKSFDLCKDRIFLKNLKVDAHKLLPNAAVSCSVENKENSCLGNVTVHRIEY